MRGALDAHLPNTVRLNHMSDRWFPATVLGGRLYIDGFGERGPWDTKRLAFQDEVTVEILVTRVGHRRVRTSEELQEVLLESEEGLPAIRDVDY